MSTDQSLMERYKNMYFGWKTVFAGAVIACWGYGSWYYGMSALFTPLIAEFGWTRAQLSLAFSMRSIEGGLEGPFGGMLIDKYGERKITIISTIIACSGLIALLYVTELWQFIFVWGFVVSLGFNLGLYDTVNSAVSKWFIRKRGRALSFVTLGGGLGGPIIVPIMAWLIFNYGWRSSLMFVAGSTLVICLPLAWFFMKDGPPEKYDMLPDGDTVIESDNPDEINFVEEYNFTPKEALKTRSFWMMLIAFMLSGGITAMVTMHQIPYLIDLGIDQIAAAGVLGLMATMSLPGRVLFAWLSDRIGERKTLIISYGMKAVGLVVFVLARNLTHILIFVAIYGAGYGGSIPVSTSLRASYFGRKAYATITGYTTFFGAISNVAYPIFAGWCYDVYKSYTFAFTVITGIQVLAMVFMYFATKPIPPSVQPV
ncbi:MFS transporter [Candidatus Bathyarchaeota archaeon]|nr:MFS transporter [Candidatus Bathyarchaeota archaeon]MBT4319379.1 MFS transporter [Candidatus Bathyarchaeota archaeon]MBT4424174.1 MFS transporter [Candidatus Bathyarchaeota archaeon]MBT7187559.1 MFS transporter [Candidatus Bathyarchaeota archaeon]MBT7346091.1 MFS transporter [Candidatus Bathyarchaeota archaeon]